MELVTKELQRFQEEWQAKKLPKLQAKAHKLWRKGQRASSREDWQWMLDKCKASLLGHASSSVRCTMCLPKDVRCTIPAVSSMGPLLLFSWQFEHDLTSCHAGSWGMMIIWIRLHQKLTVCRAEKASRSLMVEICCLGTGAPACAGDGGEPAADRQPPGDGAGPQGALRSSAPHSGGPAGGTGKAGHCCRGRARSLPGPHSSTAPHTVRPCLL